MTLTISIKQLQEQAGELLANLGATDEIIVADGDKRLAKISAVPQLPEDNGQPEEGFWKGLIETTADFDEPLPDSFWLGEK